MKKNIGERNNYAKSEYKWKIGTVMGKLGWKILSRKLDENNERQWNIL